jgi:hypothetical protein
MVDTDSNVKTNINVYVCHPGIGITKNLGAVYVAFEVVDRTGMYTGEKHTVAMPTSDAMALLQLLEHLQKKFSLAKAEEGEITEKPIPPRA